MGEGEKGGTIEEILKCLKGYKKFAHIFTSPPSIPKIVFSFIYCSKNLFSFSFGDVQTCKMTLSGIPGVVQRSFRYEERGSRGGKGGDISEFVEHGWSFEANTVFVLVLSESTALNSTVCVQETGTV